jgi:hypothetical protein
VAAQLSLACAWVPPVDHCTLDTASIDVQSREVAQDTNGLNAVLGSQADVPTSKANTHTSVYEQELLGSDTVVSVDGAVSHSKITECSEETLHLFQRNVRTAGQHSCPERMTDMSTRGRTGSGRTRSHRLFPVDAVDWHG